MPQTKQIKKKIYAEEENVLMTENRILSYKFTLQITSTTISQVFRTLK